MKKFEEMSNQELQKQLESLSEWLHRALPHEPNLPDIKRTYQDAFNEMHRRVQSWAPSQIFASVVIAQRIQNSN